MSSFITILKTVPSVLRTVPLIAAFFRYFDKLLSELRTYHNDFIPSLARIITNRKKLDEAKEDLENCHKIVEELKKELEKKHEDLTKTNEKKIKDKKDKEVLERQRKLQRVKKRNE